MNRILLKRPIGIKFKNLLIAKILVCICRHTIFQSLDNTEWRLKMNSEHDSNFFSFNTHKSVSSIKLLSLAKNNWKIYFLFSNCNEMRENWIEWILSYFSSAVVISVKSPSSIWLQNKSNHIKFSYKLIVIICGTYADKTSIKYSK